MPGPSSVSKNATPAPSRGSVICSHCKTPQLKKNLKRHTDKSHKGMPMKFSLSLSDGQSTLMNLIPSATTSNDCVTKSTKVSNSTVSEVEDTFQKITLNDDNTKIKHAEVNSEDKQCMISENNLNPKSTGLIQEIAKEVRECCNNITKMFVNISDKKAVLGKAVSPKKSKNKDLESIETRFTDDSSAVHDCKNAEQLLEVIQDRGFKYFEDSNLIMCTTCNQTNTPPVINKEGKAGIFHFDMAAYESDIEQVPDKQPRKFLNLKKIIVSHEQTSQLHLGYKERDYLKMKMEREMKSRNERIGLNLFNLRYTGIIQGKSYMSFEDDILTANLNGTDTGNINNCWKFAKKLTGHIVSVIKDIIAQNLNKPLDATNKLRPVGMVADKITPNKSTGHILALIVPIPENPLSEPLLTPVMLELPPVVDHTADGLSSQMLHFFHEAGVEDSQLEGVGVDGQYIKLGVVKKLISKLVVDGFTEEQLHHWIFETWDPSHNINKADEEIRNLTIFEWLVTFTNVVGDITQTLSIGKGLEQSKQAASDLDMPLYKLQTFSATRFAAYVENVYKNTYRSYQIIVKTLKQRAQEPNKKVRDNAKELLSKLLTVKFVGTLLGCIDIYRVIATASSELQTIDQFPWEVVAKLRIVIKKLDQMSKSLKIINLKSGENDEIEESVEIDSNEWPYLSKHLEELKSGEFHGLTLNSGAATAKEVGRITRIKSDCGKEKDLITLHNRLTSLCKYQSMHIAARTVDNQKHPFPKVISSMEDCFDIQKMIIAIRDEDYEIESYGLESLQEILTAASYTSKDADQVKYEYSVLKNKLYDLICNKNSLYIHIVNQYEHIIYKTHTCTSKCSSSVSKKCPQYMKIQEPRIIDSMKVLHLLLKFPELYQDISGILHLFLRCASKTHAESVAESMGNYIDSYSDKKRGLDINAIGGECYIKWNGPPVHLAEEIGKSALDKTFAGRSTWRFVDKTVKHESKVVSKMKRITPRLPFFSKP